MHGTPPPPPPPLILMILFLVLLGGRWARRDILHIGSNVGPNQVDHGRDNQRWNPSVLPLLFQSAGKLGFSKSCWVRTMKPACTPQQLTSPAASPPRVRPSHFPPQRWIMNIFEIQMNRLSTCPEGWSTGARPTEGCPEAYWGSIRGVALLIRYPSFTSLTSSCMSRVQKDDGQRDHTAPWRRWTPGRSGDQCWSPPWATREQGLQLQARRACAQVVAKEDGTNLFAWWSWSTTSWSTSPLPTWLVGVKYHLNKAPTCPATWPTEGFPASPPTVVAARAALMAVGMEALRKFQQTLDLDKPARLTIVPDCETSAATPWERLQEK